MVGYGGKDLQKRKVLSLEWKSEGVMDDESGGSMEPMEEVPLIQLGEAELERLVVLSYLVDIRRGRQRSPKACQTKMYSSKWNYFIVLIEETKQ